MEITLEKSEEMGTVNFFYYGWLQLKLKQTLTRYSTQHTKRSSLLTT